MCSIQIAKKKNQSISRQFLLLSLLMLLLAQRSTVSAIYTFSHNFAWFLSSRSRFLLADVIVVVVVFEQPSCECQSASECECLPRIRFFINIANNQKTQIFFSWLSHIARAHTHTHKTETLTAKELNKIEQNKVKQQQSQNNSTQLSRLVCNEI